MFEQYFINQTWQLSFFGNSLKDYFLATIVFAVFLLAINLLHRLILNRLKAYQEQDHNQLVEFITKLLSKLGPAFYLWFSLYLGFRSLAIHPQVTHFINIVMLIWIVTIIIAIGEKILTYLIARNLKKDNQAKTMLQVLSVAIKVVLWAFGALTILSNLGYNITSLVTGLGIGGVAAALAMQNILGDLFSSFAIYLDKPFKVGDFIIVGTDSGFVQKIGIKTSRLLGANGQTIVISNKDLTTARINNYHKLNERQAKIIISLGLDNSHAQLLQAIELAKQAADIPNIKTNNINLIGLNDKGFTLEINFGVKSSDYNIFLEGQQAILLATIDALKANGISLTSSAIANIK